MIFIALKRERSVSYLIFNFLEKISRQQTSGLQIATLHGLIVTWKRTFAAISSELFFSLSYVFFC